MKELQSIFTRVEENMVNPYAYSIQQPTINVHEQCVNFVANTKMEDDDIVNDKSTRDKIIKDVENIQLGLDALGKIGSLILYPDGYASKKMVMEYFGVDKNTLDSTINRNITELAENGLIKLSGDELVDYKSKIRELNLNIQDVLQREMDDNKTDLHNASHFEIPKGKELYLFNRRVILNIAMLLRDNSVAKEIRKFILDITETPHFKDLSIAEIANQINYLMNIAKVNGLTENTNFAEVINDHADMLNDINSRI